MYFLDRLIQHGSTQACKNTFISKNPHILTTFIDIYFTYQQFTYLKFTIHGFILFIDMYNHHHNFRTFSEFCHFKKKSWICGFYFLCKELGNRHSGLTTGKKAEKTEKLVTLLRSIREEKTWGKPLPPSLEKQRQVNIRSHSLPEADTYKQNPLWEKVLGYKYLHCY